MIKFVIGAMVLALVLAGCFGAAGFSAPVDTAPAAGDSGAPLSGTVTVEIVNFAFQPPVITITRGTKVIWVNRDSARHSVTDNEGRWKGGLIAQGETYETVFDQSGTYEYHCAPHPAMEGRVIVR